MAIKVNYDQPILGYIGRQNTFNFRIGWSTVCRVYRKEWVWWGEGRGGDTKKKVKFEFKQNTFNFRIGWSTVCKWSTVCRVYRKEWVWWGEVRGGDKLKFSGVVDTLSRWSYIWTKIGLVKYPRTLKKEICFYITITKPNASWIRKFYSKEFWQ